jgi:UDP-glucose:(heptosyl)LPS alpha-1,3-glucosyltransferase
MNLAFCLFNYFPYGGLQRDFMRIAKECVRRGHTVDVYTSQWEGELDPLLPVTLIAPKGWQNHTRSKHFVSEVQKVLTHKKYDLVVGFNKMPGLDVYYAADTCFKKAAAKKHGGWYRLLPRYRHLALYENAVFAEDKKTEILLIAKAEQAEFIKYYQTNPARFHLLPPGIARAHIAPSNAEELRAAARNKLQIKQDDFLLLMVGSGFKTKGLDRILHGVAALPEFLKNRTQLFVVGADNATFFKRLAKELGVGGQVHFLGGRDDVPELMLAADLLTHPAYNENTGTVLLEAIVSGLPVLTTDVCGYAHYINDAAAGMVLSSPYQQDQFNEALHTMLLSPKRTTWRENAIAFAKNADIYSMPERAVDIIESLKKC